MGLENKFLKLIIFYISINNSPQYVIKETVNIKDKGEDDGKGK